MKWYYKRKNDKMDKLDDKIRKLENEVTILNYKYDKLSRLYNIDRVEFCNEYTKKENKHS